jgi:hypothetical protein
MPINSRKKALAQLPQITPENNFSRGIIGDGAEPVRAEHAKADVV